MERWSKTQEIIQSLNKIYEIAGEIATNYENAFSAGKMIDYATLDAIKIGSLIQLGPGAYSKKVEKDGPGCRFDTFIEAGGIVGDHFHDCYEGIWVKGGKIEDLHTGSIYTTGLYIPPFVKHHIFARLPSELIVDFYPAPGASGPSFPSEG